MGQRTIFAVRMQCSKSIYKVTELASPLLLVANNEVSQVFVGAQYPIVQSISSQTTATQGVSNQHGPIRPSVSRRSARTLLITPNINADRNRHRCGLSRNNPVSCPAGLPIPIVGSNGTVTNQPIDMSPPDNAQRHAGRQDGLSLAPRWD